MTVRDRRPAEGTIQATSLPPARVYFEDLEQVVDWFRALDPGTAITTPVHEVDEISDLSDIDNSEARQVEISAPGAGLWFRLRGSKGEEPVISWKTGRDNEPARTAAAVFGHWETIRYPGWSDTLAQWLYLTFFGALIPAIFISASWADDTLGQGLFVVSGSTLLAGIMLQSLFNGTRLAEGKRPVGPSRWERNREALGNNWLVIAVTLALSVPITAVVTLLATR